MTDTQRTVLITGALGDIGRSLASAFAARGDRLALCDLAPAEAGNDLLDQVRTAGAPAAIYQAVNVTDSAAVAAFTADAAQRLGGLDVCIGNAGIVERGAVVDLSDEAWRRQLEVNLTGCFYTGREAAKVMRAANRPGHIVFISSWVQDEPREGIGAYCVSKSGLKMLAQCMALELGREQIRVNLVAPGFVDAGLTGQNLKINPGRRAEIEASIPLGRLISAEGVARAVALLCDPDAGYVTGTTLLLDGGSSLFPRK